LQFAQANRTKPKIAKEYGFPNADGQTELKNTAQPPTSVLQKSGLSANFNICAFITA